MKKILVVFLMACFAAILLFATAFAQSDGDPVVIIPYRDPPETVYSNQEIILGADWGACTPGLVQSFLTAVHLDWTLDSAPLFSSEDEVVQYWSPREPVAPGPGWACVAGNKREGWFTYWRYSLGELEAGDYEIGLHYWVDRPIIDGGDYDGDGRPDKFVGTLVDPTITIHVVDP